MAEETQPFAPVDGPPSLGETNEREKSTQVPSPSHETDATQTYAAAPNGDPAAATTHACGRFQIVKPHAQGGLGEVFVAQDDELRRRVALKRIRARFIDDEESRLRFLREAEITGNLEHPGIVPIYGLGLDDAGRPYYAMRFIEGETLRDAVKRHHASTAPAELRRGELRKLLRRFLDVCNAIDYAHSRGVIHRDLKPANIMLGKHGETLVVDWGLAKALATDDDGGPGIADGGANGDPPLTGADMQTQLGAAMGTPQFMSPEQAAGRHDELTPATDIYALGAVLFDLITGQAPITGESIPERLANVQAGKIAPPTAVRRDVPPPLASICLHALALRPADRYPTARALADDVEHWLADERVSVHRESRGEQLSRWSRTHRTAVAAAMALALTTVVGLVIGLFIVRAEQRETDRQRQAAETARLQESEQRKLAEQRERDAESARAKEAVERKRADAARDHADRTAYAAHLQAADASWESNHVAAAWDHLRAAPPAHRGWEYDYLVTKFTRDQHSFQAQKRFVDSLAFSDDGTRLMTAGGTGEVKIWNVADGRELLSLRTGGGRVFEAAFRRDGKRVAAVGGDHVIHLWDAETGMSLNSFLGIDRGILPVTDLWFDPDGERLITASSTAVRVWDPITGNEIKKIERTSSFIPGRGGFRPDGRQLAVRQSLTTVQFWDLETNKSGGTLTPAPAQIDHLVYSPDGASVAAACNDGTIKVWDVAARREVNGLHGIVGYVRATAFSPDGKRIVAAGADGTVRVWEIASGRQLTVLRGHLKPPQSVAFSPDGGRIASGDESGAVFIWDLQTGPKTTILGGPTNMLMNPTLSHDGTRLAAVDRAKTIRVWDAATGNPLFSRQVDSFVGALAFSPDDTQLAFVVGGEGIRLVDIDDRAEIGQFDGLDGNVTAIVFSPDGHRIAAGSQSNRVKTWNVSTGKEIPPSLMIEQWPTRLLFDVSGKYLVGLCKLNQRIDVWNTHDGSLNTSWTTPCSLRHQRIAGQDQLIGLQNKVVRRWDAVTGREEKALTFNVSIRAPGFSSDGRLGAFSTADKHEIFLWDIDSGRTLHRLSGHVGPVTSLEFNSDATRLVSGGDDRMVKVWDVGGGLELLTLRDHDLGMNRLQFARDGSRIVGFAQQGAVVVWDASRKTAESAPSP